MTASELTAVCHHDPGLVVLSILISLMGAHAARALSDRATAADGRAGLAWLLWAGFVDGIGTWSMHYTAKLACHLPAPVQIDWRIAALALVVGVLGSTAALTIANRDRTGVPRALLSALLLGGIGISGLHYTAMASVRIPGWEQEHSGPLVALSVLLALVLCAGALTCSFFRSDGVDSRRRRFGCVLLRGFANPAMHFTAMAGAIFVQTGAAADLSHTVSIAAVGVVGISIVPIAVLLVGLATTVVDRMKKQEVLQRELFEQAPHAIALMAMDHCIVRVNREFVRLFGYAPAETSGRRLRDLIVPEDALEESQRFTEALAQGRRVDAEGIRRRKDGTRLQVSMVHVPMQLPGAVNLVYAMYDDISGRKQAEARIKEFADQLRALSRRLLEVQEEERRHLARELHDEIGQALTAAKLNLKIVALDVPATSLGRMEDTVEILDLLLHQVRQLSIDLRPPLLDELGLIPALRSLASQQAGRTGLEINCTFEVDHLELDSAVQTASFRVVQEAMTNAIRHAQATTIAVKLEAGAETLKLSVRDNGAGFDPAAVQAGAAAGLSFGLLGMKERVLFAQGTLEIDSAPGRGTAIRVQFPRKPTTREPEEENDE